MDWKDILLSRCMIANGGAGTGGGVSLYNLSYFRMQYNGGVYAVTFLKGQTWGEFCKSGLNTATYGAVELVPSVASPGFSLTSDGFVQENLTRYLVSNCDEDGVTLGAVTPDEFITSGALYGAY